MDDSFASAATAIYAGDVSGLAALIDADPGLATRVSSSGHPTLLQLVACDAPKIVEPIEAARVLVDAGAKTHSPLVSAAGCNNLMILEFLLDRDVDVDGQDPRWSPLDEALYWANSDMAEYLLKRAASVRALSTAAGLGDASILNAFFEDDMVGASAGPIGSPFPDTVPAHLACDPKSILDHAFVMAVNNGQHGAASRLLEFGADINSKPPGYHWRGTALHAAVWRGNRELVEWVLDQGADPTIRDGLANSDALGWARHHGHSELTKLFG